MGRTSATGAKIKITGKRVVKMWRKKVDGGSGLMWDEIK
jgi:hypothetical protein